MQTTVSSNQQGLDAVLIERLNKRIEHGAPNAQAALTRLMNEAVIARDFLEPIGVSVKNSGEEPRVTFNANGHVHLLMGGEAFTLANHAVGQVAEKLRIPTRYLRDLSNGNEWERKLAARILNEHSGWTDRKRMLIRAVGNEVRGVLSDSYKPMDSEILVKSFTEAAYAKGAQLVDGHMSDTKIFLEALMPQPIAVPTVNNGVAQMAFGIRFSTSDYGDGLLRVDSFMMRGVCLNGMVSESHIKKLHLGSRMPENFLFSKETYMYNAQANASAINDAVQYILSPENIREKAEQIQRASHLEIDAPSELRRVGAKKFSKEEFGEIEKVLINGDPADGLSGKSTMWKLINGITAYSRDIDPIRSRELQSIAGGLLATV